MQRFLSAAALGCLAIVQTAIMSSAAGQSALPRAELRSGPVSTVVTSLPPTPPGRSTILGGKIGLVDSVRDELTLAVYGQRSTRIFFDERTLVYRNGVRTSLRDMRPNDRASIQTVLDGTNVFAVSVHMLSASPEGEYQGRVLSYNPQTTELSLGQASSRVPITLRVPSAASIVRTGQTQSSSASSGTSDLVKGSLVSVSFKSGDKGQAIATRVSILAAPGDTFVFTGDLSSLDMHKGLLELTDPRDDKSYEVTFDSARLPATFRLHDGDHVRVSATFDGARYVAHDIAVD